MPRLKGPLFSLQAHGTLNQELTYTDGYPGHIARRIPSPTPTYTTPQLNQRFLYRLGIALWNAMTAGQKAVYQAAAVSLPYTAMNIWLREWLTTTPSLILALPLQEGSGPTAYDLSPNAWNLTLYGPAWLPLERGYSILADGIDDLARLPTANDLLLDTAAWSLLFLRTPGTLQNFNYFFCKLTHPTHGWYCYNQSNGHFIFVTRTNGGIAVTQASANHSPSNVRTLTGISMDIPDCTIYKNGLDDTTVPGAHDIPSPSAQRATLFNFTPPLPLYWPGSIEWIIAFSRTLTAAEHLAIAQAFAPTLAPP